MSKRTLLIKTVFYKDDIIEEHKVLYSSITKASETLVSNLLKFNATIFINKDCLGGEFYMGRKQVNGSLMIVTYMLRSQSKIYVDANVKLPKKYRDKLLYYLRKNK